MTTAARRLAGIAAVWTVLIGTACFDVTSMLAPGEASKSIGGRGRQLRGELGASFDLRGVKYESSPVPFVAPLKGNRAEVPAQSVRSMVATLKAVPSPRKSISLEGAQSPTMNYNTSDAAYQAFYDTGATHVLSEAPPQDLYLTAAEMDVLTGTAVYAQDLLGDGSAIAALTVHRLAGSPYVTTTVTLNDQVMHTSTIEYRTTDGGYSKTEQAGTTYDRYGGTVGSATVRSTHEVQYTARPDVARVHYAAAKIVDFWAALPQLLESVGPSTAYAARGCSMYVKHALAAVLGITYSTMTANPWGFALGYMHLANSLHHYNRCAQPQ